MPHALFLSLALTAAAAGTPKAENLWLVTPLYPGQELLVSRTEDAIHKLLPEGSTDLVGNAALVTLLQSKRPDLGCATGERTCRNPVDDYVQSLGLAKLVLIKGGQEEPNYTFQVVSTDLVTGESHSASGSGPNLEKALLGALVKVAPLASALSVASDPPGADVFIDGEKVGKTPYDGQILPGERTLKISAAGYQDTQKTLTVGARGTITVNEKLSLAPSKLTVQITPKDAAVFIDDVGKGDGDQTVDLAPGPHTVAVKKANFEDHVETVVIEPNKTKVLVVALAASVESAILGRTSYFAVSYDQANIYPAKGIFRTDAFPIDKLDPKNGGTNPNVAAATPNGSQRVMSGFNLEYGIQRGYFGLEAVGLAARFSGGGNFSVYPGETSGAVPPYVYNNGTLVQQGSFDVIDLHAIQPQAQWVWWRFMFQAQAGFGLRTLWVQSDFYDVSFSHSNGFLNFSPYIQVQGAVRFYIVDGLYVGASIRDAYMLTGTFPEWGFSGGLGYAF